MEYIASVVYPIYRRNRKFFKTQRIMNGIRDTINGSRMCFMTGDGEIYRVGSWTQDDGCWYSNDSYRADGTRWITPKTDAKHPYSSVRMPWDDNARLFTKIMPLDPNETYRDTDGYLWGDCMLGVDGFGRLYELDPEEGLAYEAETYLDDDDV
jgi:hypothetical protein